MSLLKLDINTIFGPICLYQNQSNIDKKFLDRLYEIIIRLNGGSSWCCDYYKIFINWHYANSRPYIKSIKGQYKKRDFVINFSNIIIDYKLTPKNFNMFNDILNNKTINSFNKMFKCILLHNPATQFGQIYVEYEIQPFMNVKNFVVSNKLMSIGDKLIKNNALSNYKVKWHFNSYNNKFEISKITGNINDDKFKIVDNSFSIHIIINDINYFFSDKSNHSLCSIPNSKYLQYSDCGYYVKNDYSQLLNCDQITYICNMLDQILLTI